MPGLLASSPPAQKAQNGRIDFLTYRVFNRETRKSGSQQEQQIYIANLFMKGFITKATK